MSQQPPPSDEDVFFGDADEDKFIAFDFKSVFSTQEGKRVMTRLERDLDWEGSLTPQEAINQNLQRLYGDLAKGSSLEAMQFLAEHYLPIDPLAMAKASGKREGLAIIKAYISKATGIEDENERERTRGV